MLRSERSERLEAWATGKVSPTTGRRLLRPIRDAARWAAPQGEVKGVTLVVLSAFAFSTAGFFTRLIDTDVWTMLFWRGLFGGLFIAGYIVWRERAGSVLAFRRIGRAGLVAAGCSTAATICFVNALRGTTVADVLVINATAPFMTAGLAWAWTGARERWTTLAASLAALLGVVVTVGAALSSGHLFGNFLALLMTILISAMMVVIRRYRGVSMLPAAALSAFLCALVVWPWAEPVSATGWNFFYLAGEVRAIVLGREGPSTLRRAVRSILAKPEARRFNSLEVTGTRSRWFLGIPFVSVTANFRHIQQGLALDPARVLGLKPPIAPEAVIAGDQFGPVVSTS